MSQAPSQTRIFNRAMGVLGSTARVQSISSSNSPAAQQAVAVWDEMVRTVLADHPWNFALARARLNAGEAPPFGFARSFALPADCLRWLPPQRGDDDYFEAVEEGGKLLTDAEAPLPVRYICAAAADAIGGWPPHFVDAVVMQLAFELCESVTQSESQRDNAERRAMAELKRAKRRDGQASGTAPRTDVRASSNWLRARERPYFSWPR